MFSSYFASRFPEDMYLVAPGREEEYAARVIYGFNKMLESKIVIGMLVRDLETILPFTLARIDALRSMFCDSVVVVYENDSTDRSKEILIQSNHINLISENLDWPINEQDKSTARMKRMAYFRNACRTEMLRHNADIYMFYDSDILGGFSYEGIANSFSYNWDVCGSNSVIYDIYNDNKRRLYYDTFAFRLPEYLVDEQEHSESKNLMIFHRGDTPLNVASCFGGLGLYKKEIFENPKYQYSSDDCEHATFHIPMFLDGANILINPSQIVLYNRTRFVN